MPPLSPAGPARHPRPLPWCPRHRRTRSTAPSHRRVRGRLRIRTRSRQPPTLPLRPLLAERTRPAVRRRQSRRRCVGVVKAGPRHSPTPPAWWSQGPGVASVPTAVSPFEEAPQTTWSRRRRPRLRQRPSPRGPLLPRSWWRAPGLKKRPSAEDRSRAGSWSWSWVWSSPGKPAGAGLDPISGAPPRPAASLRPPTSKPCQNPKPGSRPLGAAAMPSSAASASASLRARSPPTLLQATRLAAGTREGGSSTSGQGSARTPRPQSSLRFGIRWCQQQQRQRQR